MKVRMLKRNSRKNHDNNNKMNHKLSVDNLKMINN